MESPGPRPSGYEPQPGPAEWLCVTGQSVLEVVGGPVFHDTTTSYRPIADLLSWYPHDIWLYVLAAGWQRLSQELPMVGRTGARGDDLGSRVVAGRLTRDIIHLGFLVERRWPPYPKWLGTALNDLPIGPALTAQLNDVASAQGWEQRQAALGVAIEFVAGPSVRGRSSLSVSCRRTVLRAALHDHQRLNPTSSPRDSH